MSILPTLAESARTLVQQAASAMLSTICNESGTPYGSVVDIAPTAQGDVILLLSQLAEHRRFIDADPRASLLIAPDLHTTNTLAKPRVSLLGRAQKVSADAEIREAYLNRHPEAEMYLSLGDFHFYQLHVERLRYIAGFGRMGWLSAEEYRACSADILWEMADDAIEHMNADHADSVLNYVQVLADKNGAASAQLVGLDRYGMSIIANGDDMNDESVRIAFQPPLTRADELRPRLVAMAQQARLKKAE